MENQIDNQKWLRNDIIAASINLPKPPHFVDITEAKQILSKNMISGILFGIGITTFGETLKLLINKQYNNICLYGIITASFFLIAIGVQYMYVTKKIRELEKEASPITAKAYLYLINSNSTAVGESEYNKSTST